MLNFMKRIIKKTILGTKWILLSSSAHKKSSLDVINARQNLSTFSPQPKGKPTTHNLLETPTCDLQIIVPAYNVENYLEPCIESILTQKTQYSFKIVLIDDGSTDNTPAIADKYADHPNVMVIH